MRQPRPILACTSDWHIAEGAWKHKGVLGDAKYALEQVVDHCVRNGTPLLAAGDLFDVDDPDPGSVRFVHRQCDRLQAAGIPLLFTVGQHERRREGTWMGTHPWPTHVGDGRCVTVEAPNGRAVTVRGFDWTPASTVPDMLAAAADGPPVDVLMLHQVCKELMGSSTSGQCELSLADVPGDAILLVGDYHVAMAKTVGRHLVVSPGSLALQEVDADPRKSFYVLDAAEGGALDPRRVPLKGRPVAHFEVAELHELDGFLGDRPWEALFGGDDLPQHLRRPIVSVTFPQELAGAHRRLLEALEKDVHYFAKAVATPKGRGEEQAAPGAANLEEALDAAVPRDSPVHALLSRLFRADPKDLGGELAEARSEFFSRRAAGAAGGVA